MRFTAMNGLVTLEPRQGLAYALVAEGAKLCTSSSSSSTGGGEDGATAPPAGGAPAQPAS